jgi:regulator of protease activity HflC (stomatin/prohibitin superfamily)
MVWIWIAITILVIFCVIGILVSSSRIIQPWEQGLLVVFGSYKRPLHSGYNLVPPMVSQVIRVDLRTQVLEVPRQEVITKDNSPTRVDAVIYIKVIDPRKAIFEVTDYSLATILLAQTTLRSLIGDMELDEVLYNRAKINLHLRDVLDESSDKWGVRVEAVEIREVDPVGKVKAAMEEQTSAERQRRAAILKADGEKRSAILVAEGDKRSRILQAEGMRQSKILEAEGQRLATILEAQGEAQKLRVIALGSAPLDKKALTVLSLDTVKAVGNGQATKIIFPFELTKLVEGAAEYLGTGKGVPERESVTFEQLEKIVGKAEDVLGDIPKQEELRKELSAIENEMKSEANKTEEIAQLAEKGSKVNLVKQVPKK